jgi:hypothetical protein
MARHPDFGGVYMIDHVGSISRLDLRTHRRALR